MNNDVQSNNTGFLAQQGRRLVIVGIILFAISTAFPIVAALIKAEDLPTWIGLTDVGLALVFVIAAFALDAANKGNIPEQVMRSSYRVYRSLGSLPLILLVLFFLVGNTIRWDVLLPGLAWRTWIFTYMLPVGLTLWDLPKRK
ncbi:MAG: hypothetical protein ABIQ44_03120 [Chloroflexia bacterium]